MPKPGSIMCSELTASAASQIEVCSSLLQCDSGMTQCSFLLSSPLLPAAFPHPYLQLDGPLGSSSPWPTASLIVVGNNADSTLIMQFCLPQRKDGGFF